MGSQRPASAIVAYPGVMTSALHVARAFAERGLLARYETTFVFCPDRPLDSWIAAGGKLLGARVDRVLSRRFVSGLPDDRVRRSPGWDLLRVATRRLGVDEAKTDRVWERMMLAFDRGVADRLGPPVDMVYGFEQGCRATFVRAGELGMFRVLDMAAPHFALVEPLLAAEAETVPALQTPYVEAMKPRLPLRNERKTAEFELASLIIANSSFTARSLEGTGVDMDKVRVVPRAAPEIDPGWRLVARTRPPLVLFAGSVSIRKGAHLLLDAWRMLNATQGAELLLAGQWLLPEAWRRSLPAGVRVVPWLTRAELRDAYQRATVLVLPSLFDGFGLVVTEALAHGLPVITTHSTGAADLIEDGRNGWVIETGNVAALAERIQHCIDHPAELDAMREAAEQSAARRPWSVFRSELIATVQSALLG